MDTREIDWCCWPGTNCISLLWLFTAWRRCEALEDSSLLKPSVWVVSCNAFFVATLWPGDISNYIISFFLAATAIGLCQQPLDKSLLLFLKMDCNQSLLEKWRNVLLAIGIGGSECKTVCVVHLPSNNHYLILVKWQVTWFGGWFTLYKLLSMQMKLWEEVQIYLRCILCLSSTCVIFFGP